MDYKEKLKHKRVLEIFEKICSIPHGSGDMEKISAFCIDFAENIGLECYRDELYNVVIKKSATKGFENSKPVILQGHLDMVCEKDADKSIDFLNDAIDLIVDGDFISADGTTLGGDDGIAVAMILAVLESDSLEHPALEAIFTVDEETGMYGADALDTSLLSGKILINIDSEEEGVLTVGCAGGARVDISLALSPADNIDNCYRIAVSGLNGGHSGVDINRGGLNANKVLGGALKRLKNCKIVDIAGGLKDNAIPREAYCVVALDYDPTEAVRVYYESVSNDYDTDLIITVEKVATALTVFDSDSTNKLVGLLNDLPSGIIAMDKHLPELVETSLNLGMLFISEITAHFTFSVRSSMNAAKNALIKRLEDISGVYGAEFETHGHYPPWEYVENSPLRDIMVKTYNNMFGKNPEVITIHAGLECGMFSSKIDGLDCVSFGPNMFDIHTTRERLSISSVERTYDYLCRVLKNLQEG